jgi:8-hydroxy-5-deazaflavin:NADPH oxidoreductase
MTLQLNHEAGYESVYTGPLRNAVDQESLIGMVFAISEGGMGPFVYRIAPPDQLVSGKE